MSFAAPYCVLDSGVFAKIFLKEHDRDLAIDLMSRLATLDVPIYCPDIFIFEVLSISAQNNFSLKSTLDLLSAYQKSGLQVFPLTANQWTAVIQMAENGHPKSGFPSVYDAAYHVMAISDGGVFVTADKKHVAKTRPFGHVCLLGDYAKLFLED